MQSSKRRRMGTGGRRRRTTLSATVAVLLLVSACGESGGDPVEDAEDAEDADGDEGEATDDSDPEEEDAADPDSTEAATDDFPSDDITLIVPAGPGGNQDTTSRQVAAPLGEELGVQVVVDNVEGGQQMIGAQEAANGPADCTTLLYHVVPNLPLGYMTLDMDFTYDDFYPVSTVMTDAGLIRVSNDSPWETLDDLIEDARENPGQITLAPPNLNYHYMMITVLEEQAGVEFNKVTMGGSGALYTGFRGGEYDAIFAGAYSSSETGDMSRVLAVQGDSAGNNPLPDRTNDAPTFEEAAGIDYEGMGMFHGIFVPRECKEEYPDRYETIREAVVASLDSDELKSALADLDEEEKIIRPPVTGDELHQRIVDFWIPFTEDFLENARAEGLI